MSKGIVADTVIIPDLAGNLPQVISRNVNPMLGAGVVATLGTVLIDTLNNRTWQKVGAAATAWSDGSTQRAVTVANTPYTILTTDDYLFVDTSGGAVLLNLPDPTKFVFAKEYFLMDSAGVFGTNNCTLHAFAGEKIEGLAATDKVFQTNWGRWTIVTNGVDWFVG